MKWCSLILLPLLLAPVHGQVVPPDIDFGIRTWTNTDGREIEAQLESADEKQVHLKLAASGKTVPVPLAKLSQADRDYARDWIIAREHSWKIEVISDKERPSFKPTRVGGNKYSGTTIKPTDPDHSLMLLLFRVTPPPEVPIGSFDEGRLQVKVTADSKLVSPVVKYVLQRRAKDLEDYGAGDRGILYEIPKRARLAEVKYNRPKVRPKK